MPYYDNTQRGLNVATYNVKDYSAVGDGYVDDWQAITNCIAASVSGSTVYFPAGTYLVSKTIQLVGGRSYVGTSNTSFSQSVITQPAGANLAAIMAAYEWVNNITSAGAPIIVQNFVLDGAFATNATGTRGLVLQNSDSQALNIVVQNCSSHGIVLTSVCRGGGSVGNTITENTISRCIATSCNGNGIYVQDNTAQCRDSTISDCIIRVIKLTGIQLDNGTGFRVQNNHVYNINGSAINCNGGFATLITGNYIFDFGLDYTGVGQYYEGIALTVIDPVSSTVCNNIINSAEVNASNILQYLNISGGGAYYTLCNCYGNSIYGGYVAAINATLNAAVIVGINTVAFTNTNAHSDSGIRVGSVLSVAAPNAENVTVTAVQLNGAGNIASFTATFVNTHLINVAVTGAGVAASSMGLLYQANSTQISSGFNFLPYDLMNTIAGCGTPSYIDTVHVTMQAVPSLGPDSVSGNFSIGGHLLATGASASVTNDARVTSGVPPAPTISGNDTRGQVQFGTGTTVTAGVFIDVTFATAYAIMPFVSITAANAGTSGKQPYLSSVTTTGFTFATNVALTASQATGTYSFYYTVTG